MVYPLVFLYGLIWEKIKDIKITTRDFFLAGIATWSIVFLTLPYAPVALLLFGLIFFPTGTTKKSKLILAFSFFLPSLITLASLPLKDYLFDLLVVNQKPAIDEARSTGMVGLGILKSFFYTILIFSQGKFGFFQKILISLDFILLISSGLLLFRFKKFKEVLFIFTVMDCALTRFVPPGKTFYESFHLLPWYSLFIFSIFILVKNLFLLSKNKTYPCLISYFLIVVFFYLITSPSWFVWEKIDSQTEFSTNYTHYFALGQTIKTLSSPQDTLFLDLWDDLIYW